MTIAFDDIKVIINLDSLGLSRFKKKKKKTSLDFSKLSRSLAIKDQRKGLVDRGQ